MNSNDETDISSSPCLLPPSEATPLCANCAGQSCLKVLVAELLYKNQVLRFKLSDLEEQLRLQFVKA
jgi:hypothetical protein